MPTKDQVWGAADRVLATGEREANHALRDEAWVEARACEAENVALRARQAEMEAEIATLRKEVRRLLAAEFWDWVMREVANVLPVSGTMSAEEIVMRLPPTLAQEAIAVDRPMTPGRLRRKMAIRVEHRRYFERDDETGRYGRLTVQIGR